MSDNTSYEVGLMKVSGEINTLGQVMSVEFQNLKDNLKADRDAQQKIMDKVKEEVSKKADQSSVDVLIKDFKEQAKEMEGYIEQRPLIRKEMERDFDAKLEKKLNANDWRVWIVGGFISLLLLGVGKQYVDMLPHPNRPTPVVQTQPVTINQNPVQH